MTVDEKTRQALDSTRLSLPDNPPVIGIEAEEYVDTSGEDALRVWVILPEEFDLDKLTGDDVLALKATIRRTLRDQNIEQFPYIHLAKPSEREESLREEA